MSAGADCALGTFVDKELERARVYREQAGHLLNVSNRMLDERQRTLLLDLAATYHRLAEQLEEIHRLDIKPRE